MSDLSTPLTLASISDGLARAWRQGMDAFRVPDPKLLSVWMEENFYLSKESSYDEGAWKPWAFHPVIADCVGQDGIEEVDFRKSARVGATKILLAFQLYTALVKRRNQILWRQNDEKRDEYVRTELDPALRDVPVMRAVLPRMISRDSANTLKRKSFIGSLMHMLGGQSANNFRGLSADTMSIDEINGFPWDIDKEGGAFELGWRRISGATRKKAYVCSTPTIEGFSQIDERVNAAQMVYRFHVPCPHCGVFHPLLFGGKGENHGFKWTWGDPDSVRHLCASCGAFMTQAQYLEVAPRGQFHSDCGHYLVRHLAEQRVDFFNPAGEPIRPFRHIAFTDIWTAHAENVNWPSIVTEFETAWRVFEGGDDTKLKSFYNLTLGRCWGGNVEANDADDLMARAEDYPTGIVPLGALILLAFGDVQDNRIEIGVWGFAEGRQMWAVEHRIFHGNPAEDAVWREVEHYLFEHQFHHASGVRLGIYASAFDTGGHNTQAVYAFCARHARRRVKATKGASGREKNIRNGANPVDLDWRGRKDKNGVVLHSVGTNLAKDLLQGMLGVERAGPGYVHLTKRAGDGWFKQFTSEQRAVKETATGSISRWGLRPGYRRNEVWDCGVGALWLWFECQLDRKTPVWWRDLEARVQPPTPDLFVGLGDATPVPDGADMPVVLPRSGIGRDKPQPIAQSKPKPPPRPIRNDNPDRLRWR